MAAAEGQWEVKECPILGHYNKQRFVQWSPEDSANFYLVTGKNTKQNYALYPVMGRAHINFLGTNQLIFGTEPRGEFKTINYAYIVDGATIYQIDSNYNKIAITGATPTTKLSTTSGPIYFTFLVVNTLVFACFVDNEFIYIYQEGTPSLQRVTDPLAPGNFTIDGKLTKPGYIAAFGNRLAVSVLNSSQFILSAINLVGNGGVNPPGYNFDPSKCWTNYTEPQVFTNEDGIIRQMGVLNNTLYIFCDYITGVWSNIAATVQRSGGTGVLFPWKKNTTYNWNFGIANPTSLDIDFGMLVFLARNSDGLLEFRMSSGDQPEKISDKAIDTLLQKYTNDLGSDNPFLSANSNGFLFQYENTIFYRMSGGPYTGSGLLDQTQSANSIEFNFETKTWHRLIELNGERNRIQNHVYFNYKHLVTVVDDNTVYEMSGKYYVNEVRNTAQADEQAFDAYIAYPFQYERVTPIIYQKGYIEFETEYVQIDFVWGETNIAYSLTPFDNTQFIIDEEADGNGDPQYLISEQPDAGGNPVFIINEQGNYPTGFETFYNSIYKPHIELYYSDDGGVSYETADVMEFSTEGIFSWRMRWYQLGCSRNRVYKLIAVSPVPIVILGATMKVRRVSGGAD